MAAMAFAIPLIILNLSEITGNRYVKTGLLLLLGGGIVISGIFRFARYGSLDKTAEFRRIVTYLAEEDVFAGYATFWNGNVLTELSDGTIEVWVWEDDVSAQQDVDTVLLWLQDGAHQDTVPEGRTFLLLTRDEYALYQKKEALEQRKADYQSENYLLFLFDGHEEMTRALQ